MSTIDMSSVMETISSLETQLTQLRSLLGDAKKTKQKRAVNPDAKPNAWIDFLKRINALLKEAKHEGPATIGVLFAKHLKDSREGAYEMDTTMILEAFEAWATPEQIAHAKSLKRAKKDSSAASSVVAASDAEEASDAPASVEKKERKKREPMTEEAKAARKEKMAAKKAAAEPTPAAEPAPAAPAAPAAPVAAPTVVAPGAPKKAFAKKKLTYTMEQLKDFDEFEHEGETYGRNIRGDVVNGEGAYAGNWNGTDIVEGAPPADWETVMA
jgi:hypothetical protein